MIGERLAELRKDRGWDQKELADKLKVTFHTVSSYERNRSEPNNEMLKKMAELFDISADYLLGLTRMRCSYIRDDDNTIVLPNGLSKDQVLQIKKFIEFTMGEKGSVR